MTLVQAVSNCSFQLFNVIGGNKPHLAFIGGVYHSISNQHPLHRTPPWLEVMAMALDTTLMDMLAINNPTNIERNKYNVQMVWALFPPLILHTDPFLWYGGILFTSPGQLPRTRIEASNHQCANMDHGHA